MPVLEPRSDGTMNLQEATLSRRELIIGAAAALLGGCGAHPTPQALPSATPPPPALAATSEQLTAQMTVAEALANPPPRQALVEITGFADPVGAARETSYNPHLYERQYMLQTAPGQLEKRVLFSLTLSGERLLAGEKFPDLHGPLAVRGRLRPVRIADLEIYEIVSMERARQQ